MLIQTIRAAAVGCLLTGIMAPAISAAIVDVQLLGRVSGFSTTASPSLQSAFPLGQTATIGFAFDDSVPNAFPPGFFLGAFTAASDITFGVSGQNFLLSGADTTTGYSPGVTTATYGFGAPLGAGTASGSGLGFDFSGLGADLIVEHAAPDLLPATNDFVEIIEEIIANGSSPIDGSYQLNFIAAGGSVVEGVEFDITQFVSSSVPEPASLALAGLGFGLLGLRRR